MPTGYTRIYADWDDETDIFGDGDEPLAVWCDKDNSGSIEAGEETDDNRIWNFGTSSEYPAIRCTPIAPAEWRSWWFLNGTGEPQLDESRLDELLPSFSRGGGPEGNVLMDGDSDGNVSMDGDPGGNGSLGDGPG